MGDMKTAQPMHEESKNMLELIKNLKRYDQLENMEAVRARSRAASAFGNYEVEFDGRRDEHFVPSPEVPTGVPIYVYVPNKMEPNPPIFIFCHGGGNVVGDRLNVETMCYLISKGANCVVVNVEYRLAPEHKFPAGLNDACDVTRWVLQNKTKIGGGSLSKVGISGDSAGGQLAAGVAHDVPGLAFQVLVYAHVSARGDRSLVSFQEYKEGPILHKDLVDWFENHMAEIKDWRHPRLSNSLRGRFDHLPPCLFIVAQCDPLRDDSYEYAKLLRNAGVHNELHLAVGAIHAFFTLPKIFPTLTGEAYAKVIDFIRRFGTADTSKY